jgi:hypothetical protein
MKVGTLVVLAMAACAPALGAEPGTRNPLVAQVVSEVSPARIEANIRKLASFGTRHSSSDTNSQTRGIGAARRWIKAELDRCSQEAGGRLRVDFDEHRAEASERVPVAIDLVNVVATLPGDQPESRGRVYVVSGHYDSRRSDPNDAQGDSPGANDDASGTAVSMELACVMAKHRFDATLVFLAVSGEEQGLLGAYGWARDAKAKGLDVAGMFTNDIVGNTRSMNGKVERGRVRLFAVGVPASKAAMSDELADILSTGGENDVPARQLARFVKDAAERNVPGMKVDIVWRRDRYLRGGDHIAFLDQGYAALRFTEPAEDFRRQHQDVRMVDGIQWGDLPEFVDFAYVADVARVNGAALAALALGPSAPREVQVENLRLEPDTTLRWQRNPEPDVAGYRIVWRDTTAADWQHFRDVGEVTRATLADVSKDDFQFGVQAYDREGNLSVASYPRPYRDVRSIFLRPAK